MEVRVLDLYRFWNWLMDKNLHSFCDCFIESSLEITGVVKERGILFEANCLESAIV